MAPKEKTEPVAGARGREPVGQQEEQRDRRKHALKDDIVKTAFRPVRRDRLLNECSGTTEYTLMEKKLK